MILAVLFSCLKIFFNNFVALLAKPDIDNTDDRKTVNWNDTFK